MGKNTFIVQKLQGTSTDYALRVDLLYSNIITLQKYSRHIFVQKTILVLERLKRDDMIFNLLQALRSGGLSTKDTRRFL